MKSFMRTLLFTLCCWGVGQVPSTSFSQEKTVPFPHVELPGTQLLTVSSVIVGRDYDLCISLPRYYDDTTRSFPVAYVLDAQWDFPLVRAIYGSQYYDGFVPGLIIVGIMWGGEQPNHDSLRAADLTPTRGGGVPQSGNAPNFLTFIKDELAPFIESRFRTKAGDRTLMGSSYGGLFTLYAMLQENPFFQRYVLTSPAIGFDNRVIERMEEQYAAGSSSLPVRLYMAHGQEEGGVVPFRQWVERLQSRSYAGLKMQTKVLENTGHSGSKAEGYTRGLQWVFERPSLSLERALLKEYEGSYDFGGGRFVRVAPKDGRLTALPPGNSEVVLHAEGNDRFYAKGFFMNVEFQRDGTGKVIALVAEQYGGSTQLKKLP